MTLLYRISRWMTRAYFRLFFRMSVEGLENLCEGPALIVANHTSFFDPPIIAAALSEEVHFLARSTLFKIPILGSIIRALNAHPLQGGTRDISSIKTVIQLVQNKHKILLFPEGRRSPTGQLQPIKSGIGMLALKCQCPVIPIHIEGAFEAWPCTKRFPKLWGEIHVRIGHPLRWSANSPTHAKELQKTIAEEVGSAIEKLRFSIPQ